MGEPEKNPQGQTSVPALLFSVSSLYCSSLYCSLSLLKERAEGEVLPRVWFS